MTVDHSEFIAKHHRTLVPEDKQKISRKGAIVSVLLVIVYLVICTVAAIMLEIQREAVIAAGVAFVAASAISYYVQKSFHIRTAQEKERELIKEVLEGSRGARLITDSRDKTVYANEKFEGLCEDFGFVGKSVPAVPGG